MHNKTSEKHWVWLAVLGVVYGDIGTSPLYALKGCPQHDIVGLISVFIWTLFLIVSLKYVGYILRLDNKGEGGILALVTLCQRLSWGVIGLSLFLGDSILTPAISVLGALEGLDIATPNLAFGDAIPGLASILLLVLFMLQRLGTSYVGKLFGPIMAVWFVMLAMLGLPAIVAHPAILKAFDPRHAAEFLMNGSTSVWMVMGHALLAVTGAEALYADLGHFGKKPIQKTWLWVVWPALMLNYLGQGALLLVAPTNNPFYALAPSWGILPLVVLATMASLVASQAVISGIFSLSWQGMMLGYLPRMRVVHTSEHHVGQIYVPAMNTLMCWGTLFAVGFFQSSESLGMAYGVSVASLMWITTVLALMTKPPLKWAIALCCVGLCETGLVLSSLTKFWYGAWYAFAMAIAACYVIIVWRSKIQRLYNKSIYKRTIQSILDGTTDKPCIPGVGVFVQKVETTTHDAPLPLILHERYYNWLPEKVICINIVASRNEAKIRADERYESTQLSSNVYVIQATYGFKEMPDLKRILAWAQEQGFLTETDADPSFYWGCVMPAATQREHFWRNPAEKLFILLARLQTSQHELIRAPYAQTLELVTHVKV